MAERHAGFPPSQNAGRQNEKPDLLVRLKETRRPIFRFFLPATLFRHLSFPPDITRSAFYFFMIFQLKQFRKQKSEKFIYQIHIFRTQS